MFAIAGLVAAPVFIDLNKYKTDFATVIKTFTGAYPVIEGNVNVAFLPSPTLTLGRINVPNAEGASSPSILVADGVVAKFTFASLIKGKFDPSAITLIRPHLELEKMENGDNNWAKLYENHSTSGVNDALNVSLNVIIKNGVIVYHSEKEKTTIDNISSNLKIASANGPIDFKGNFLLGATILNFSGEIGVLNANSKADFNINSDSFDFGLIGNYRPGNNFDIKGTASLNVKDMGKFTDSFLSTVPIISKIASNESLSANGDFLISNEITSFNKLNIDSKSIKGKGSVDILYNSGKDNGVQWDVDFKIDKINTDSLRAKKETSKQEGTDLINYYKAGADSFNLASYHFDLPTNLSALLSFTVGEVIYNNDKISNISIDTDIFNGKAIIHSFSAELPGNSKIELIGNIDHNGSRPLLTGKLRAYGSNLRKALVWLLPEYSFIPENELKEFLFLCDMNVTPRKVTISNIYGSFDRSLVSGSLFLRPSDVIPSIKADIKLDRFDFDRYNATKQIDRSVRDFLAHAKDTNIDTSWLKLFGYNLLLSVGGDEIVYNGNNIKNFSVGMGVAKGVMNVQNISIDSDMAKFQGKVNIDFNKEIPVINIDINSKYFDTASFIINDNENKENEASEANKSTNASIWSKNEFNLMGLGRFEGELNLIFETLKHKDNIFKYLSMNGNLKAEVFAINQFKWSMGENGKVDVKGNIGVSKEAPSLGISIAASAINVHDLLLAIGSKNQMKGIMYFGGVLKTFGLSPFEWVKELKLTAKLAMRDIEIEGIDIPMIIDQSKRLYSVIDMNTVIKNATQDGKTTFSAIDGKLTSDKSILQTKDLSLSTDRSRGIFVGNLSLHNLKMNGLAKIGYLPEENKRVIMNFNLSGTAPDAVTYTLDSTNLEQYITGKAK